MLVAPCTGFISSGPHNFLQICCIVFSQSAKFELRLQTYRAFHTSFILWWGVFVREIEWKHVFSTRRRARFCPRNVLALVRTGALSFRGSDLNRYGGGGGRDGFAWQVGPTIIFSNGVYSLLFQLRAWSLEGVMDSRGRRVQKQSQKHNETLVSNQFAP